MKNYSQAILDALANNNATANLLEMQLAGGTVYLTDANRNIPYNGQTYIASGLMLSVADLRQQSQFQVQSIGVQFTTADQSVVALFSQNQKGRTCILTEVIFDDYSKDIVGQLQQGRFRVNAPSQRTGDADDVLSIDLTNFMSEWKARRGLRTTQASHQVYYPNSTSFINSMDVKEIEWGG